MKVNEKPSCRRREQISHSNVNIVHTIVTLIVTLYLSTLSRESLSNLDSLDYLGRVRIDRERSLFSSIL